MKQKVALVLGSGGARGVAHIGVIQELQKQGFEISSVAGSSMGAVVGGVYAAGKLDEYTDWVSNFDRFDVIKLLDFTLSLQGFVRGERVFKEMEKLMGDYEIDRFDIPFAAIATNIRKKEEVIYNSGSLMKALRASCAIPTVMTPVYEEDGEIIDGGVLNPIPVNRVQRSKDDLLVVVNVNADIPYERIQKSTPSEEAREKLYYQTILEQFRTRWKSIWPSQVPSEIANPATKKLGIFDLLNRSIDLMQDELTTQLMDKYKPDMLINVSRNACATFEFYKSNELIGAGRDAFQKAFKQYQKNALEATK
jgi:NTE family protein